MITNRLKKTIIKALPYVLMGFICTNLGEAWRLAEGADASKKLLSFFSTLGPAFTNPLPSFHPVDLLVGAICGGALWLAVYIRHKNAKHFKHNQEYGSARWGGLPFILLSDPELQAIQAYGVWQEKKLYGKVSMGVVRTTYIIDENGVVEAVMPKVKPDTNAAEILVYLG